MNDFKRVAEDWTPGDLPKGFNWRSDWGKLCNVETKSQEISRRHRLHKRAKRLMEEYEQMTEEEKKEFEREHNKPGKFTKEELEEIAKSDMELPKEFETGDLKARPIREYRVITQALFKYLDPEKNRPVWTHVHKELEEQDVSIGKTTLKRFWSMITKKDEYALWREEMNWRIMEELEPLLGELSKHVLDRVGSEGGQYDSIKQRMAALKMVQEMMSDMGGKQGDQPQVKVDNRKQEVKQFVFKEYSEEEVEEIQEDGAIDIEPEDGE